MTKKWQVTSVSLSRNEIGIQDGWLVVWAIRYDDGRIAYDRPEILPKYAKELVEKTFARLFDDKLACNFNVCKWCRSVDKTGIGLCGHINGGINNSRTTGMKVAINTNGRTRLEVIKCNYYSTIHTGENFLWADNYRSEEKNKQEKKNITEIKVKRIEDDFWGNQVYKNISNGKIYTLVDGRLHTTTEEGEPDRPLRKDLKITIVK